MLRHALGLLAVIVVSGLAASGLRAQQPVGPLSAIDWLRRGAEAPQTGAYPVTPPPESSNGGISVRALDALRPEAVGLFPAARVGLPASLWANTSAETLVPLIETLPDDTLPALRELAFRLLLAEFDAPLSISGVNDPVQDPKPEFLLARLNVLERFGALDQAAAILDTLGSDDPYLRARRLDFALLLGDEDRACDDILNMGAPLHDKAAHVYCLARAERWDEADALLQQGMAGGMLDATAADLLTQFLHEHDALPGSDTLLPPSSAPMTPLTWRLTEALGTAISTQSLPIAFAHADLRGTSGWRAQIEAAERLVRARALPSNRLLGLYTERRAAASGGIWERVRALSALDAALTAADTAAVASALPDAWAQSQGAELEVAVADLFTPALAPLALQGEAADIAFTMGLLSTSYETVALGVDVTNASRRDRFLAAIARGLDPAELGGAMPGELPAAIAQVFGPEPPVPIESRDRLAQGALGAEMLATLGRLSGAGDPRALAEGLSTLRLMGLEDIVRRAALEVLLIERRG